MKPGKELVPYKRPSLVLSPKTHAAVVSYATAAAGLGVALFPGVIDNVVAKVVIIALCVVVAALGLLWPFVSGNMRALYGRVRDYPQLHVRATTDSERLSVLRQNTLELMQASSLLEKEGAHTTARDPKTDLENLRRGIVGLATVALEETTYRIKKQSMDKDKVVLVLEDKDAFLAVGDKVRVVHTADLYEMGTFRVVETIEGEQECYALGENDVDGLWSADIKRSGESSVVLTKRAILIERGSG
jgi:hypothetical protein